MTNTKTLEYVQIALFAVLITVCSWISIPFVIPFTLQTFAVFAAMLVLGGKRGTVAVLLYMLLGAVGLPVFAGFKSGMGILAGPTGGYVIGFVLIGLCYMAAEKLFSENYFALLASLVIGLFLCYAAGTIWFINVYSGANAVSVQYVLSICVYPYIVPDLCKLALAAYIAKRVKKYI
ncbi:MAG: biotin transporter BioY [Eubacteriales bacterium]|nr:biotin transporter BioY [Eubacteriales bacterium]